MAFLVPACRPTPRFYPLTFTLFGITRIALKWTAPHIGPAQHNQCWIKRRNWFSENGSESRDGADEPCLPPDNLPTLPSEGLPVSLRQRDGSGEQIVNILVTRIKTQSCPQTDYFCTVCEESLKEEELQSHLFEGHSAENLQVRAGTDALNQYRSSELQYCQCFLKHTPIHCLPSSMRWCYLTLTIL